MSLLNKPKSEMTPEELQKREEEEFNTGPLSVLTHATRVPVKKNTRVLINCQNNKKLPGRVKAFDSSSSPCRPGRREAPTVLLGCVAHPISLRTTRGWSLHALCVAS
uniref:Small nuclear ribonucleoprotein Sm D2 n=1 Tax=Podarcis muralis TaxID=64176 RepID=A0A670I998_PODMU